MIGLPPAFQTFMDDYSFPLSLSTDKVVAFTWNPNSKFYHSNFNNPKKWQHMCIHMFKHLKRSCDHFAIVPEVSLNGRLHAHGYVCISDSIKWKLSTLPMLLRHGSLKLKFHVDEHWHNYVLKELVQTRSVLRTFCIFTSHNLKRILREWKYEALETIADTVKHLDMSLFQCEADSDVDSFSL